MINATDLRLGNKVLDIERGEVVTVIGIEPDRVQLKPSPYIWTTCDKIEGIKINDEWLKSYGFEYVSICGKNRYVKKGFCLWVKHTPKGNSIYYHVYLTEFGERAKVLTFLHELQNSYKEVEGTELKIKV